MIGCKPAALAYAAMDADVLPVDTQATRVIPRRSACATPQVMPLSLKDPVGLNPWCLNTTGPARRTPPPERPGSSGVQPSRSVTTRE